MNPNAKRNMIQVRLSDDELRRFEVIRQGLKAKNNASALRQLIQLAPLVGKQPQAQVEHLLKIYDDLDAKAAALLWNSSNMTKNLNEFAHAANIAKNNDPANKTTWNWIIEQLKNMFPTIEQLNELGNETKDYLKKELDAIGGA